jgi:serine/threonine protein kinase
MPAQDHPLLTAGTVIGQRYQVVRAVAQGGMGAIYEAHDTRLGNRRCAIKVLLDAGMTSQDQAEAATWFAREAQILSGLHHPLIPNISDYFSDHGYHYLVMDFVDGQTLEHVLTHRGTPGLPVEEVVGWGRELCSVLEYLHTRQPPVIFRDLKPANIMLENWCRVLQEWPWPGRALCHRRQRTRGD